MNEDTDLEQAPIASLVKNALEEGTDLKHDTLRVLLAEAERTARRQLFQRRVRLWGASTLLAASIAGVILLSLTHLAHKSCTNEVALSSDVEEAIVILGELSALANSEQAAESAGERLQLWQEAPCADLF